MRSDSDAVFFELDDSSSADSTLDVPQPISNLIKAQLSQFKEIDDQLPTAIRTGIDIGAIRTEREAADYIQMVTARLAQSTKNPAIIQQLQTPTDPRQKLHGAGDAKRQIGPSTRVARDRWTVHDELGHYPYAYGIYRFLTNDETKPPLAISIQAPWGGGKTSIMRMIQAQLDPEAVRRFEKQPNDREGATVKDVLPEMEDPKSLEIPAIEGGGKRRVTVWFNAWKYESTSQVWSGLADSIVQQVSDRLNPLERELFLFRLQLRRVDASIVRQKIHEQVVAYFTEKFVPWLWAYVALPAGVALVGKFLHQPHVEQFGWIGVLLSAIGAVSVGWNRAKADVEKQPARLNFGEFVKPPDYDANLGFVHHVTNDLKKVFDLIPEKYRPMVIFVDDLDRCSPNKVADVIEALNLFLAGEFPDCMFVLGIDDEMIAAALDKAHSDVIAKLPAYARSTSIGWRFMDKFVQLPFVVPPPSDERLKKYAESLLSESAGIDMGVREKAARAVEGSNQEPKEVAQQVADDEKLNPAQRQGLEAEMVIIKQMDSDITAFTDGEQEIKSLLVAGAIEFSTNPRDVKRYVNVFRFHYFLRAARERHNEPVASLAQMSRWIIFSLKWPEAIRWLRRSQPAQGLTVDPHAEALEKAAKHSKTEEDWRKQAGNLLGIKPEEKAWVFGEDVRKFFREQADFPKKERFSSSCGKGLW